jgi:hypothetical protein
VRDDRAGDVGHEQFLAALADPGRHAQRGTATIREAARMESGPGHATAVAAEHLHAVAADAARHHRTDRQQALQEAAATAGHITAKHRQQAAAELSKCRNLRI